MREKLGEISIDRIKDKYKLPSIPDLFAIDDRGQAHAFRYSMNNNSYSEYDKTYYQAHSAFFADLGLDRLFNDSVYEYCSNLVARGPIETGFTYSLYGSYWYGCLSKRRFSEKDC